MSSSAGIFSFSHVCRWILSTISRHSSLIFKEFSKDSSESGKCDLKEMSSDGILCCEGWTFPLNTQLSPAEGMVYPVPPSSELYAEARPFSREIWCMYLRKEPKFVSVFIQMTKDFSLFVFAVR
ncbi:hypothetical protein TNCT_586261 [Trichonephila clavata]|uniref:Uncharacterized protein n=1 Tax=Trichonephila clavata TaxID=2740835 RepID=A0A8X6LL72_TRICU|nr:hypothetical protein TNCT_586261 [Trichonephila clavata]